MPKRLQRSRTKASRSGRRLSPWLLLGALPLAAGQQILRRNFRVNNPELALRQGSNLVQQQRRVLAVARHHDVLEFLAGGTLRLLRLAGSHVTAVVGARPNQTEAPPTESNRTEFHRADASDTVAMQSYDALQFFTPGQRGLQGQPSLERQLRDIWAEVQPDLIFTIDPAFPLLFFGRPDHVVVGQAVLTLARALGDGSTAQRPEVLFFGTREGNVIVDMGEVIEEKIAGVLVQSEQSSEYPKVYSRLARTHGRLVARQADVHYAETFRALSLPPLHQRAYHGSWSVYQPDEPAAEKSPESITGPRRLRL